MQVFPRLLWDLRITGLWTNLLHKAAHSAASQERLELPSPLPVPANQTHGSKLTVYLSLEVGWEAYSLPEQKQRGLIQGPRGHQGKEVSSQVGSFVYFSEAGLDFSI